MEPVDGVHPGWLVVAALIGVGLGVAASKAKVNLPASEVPTDLAYFAANQDNLFPTNGIVLKHVGTSGYAVGRAVGNLWK